MKSGMWVSLAAFFGALLVIGCGGGGGGGTTGGGPGGGPGGGGGSAPEPGQYVEFSGINRPGNLDPLQLQVGDDIQLESVNYSPPPTSTRTVLSGRNWATNAPGNAVALGANGRLTILSRVSGVFSVTVNVTVAGQQKQLHQDFAIKPATNTTVSGRVADEDNAAGIEYIQVTFYDASGSAVSGARTGENGVFNATVPDNVASVSIKASTVAIPKYYRSFYHGGKIYTMDASTCPLRLTLKKGQSNSLGAFNIFLQENGPPPPPDGCKP